MRPSIEIDSGLLVPPSQRSGTGRHTLPGTPTAIRDRISLGGMADDFFSAGDDGSYEGAEPEPLEGVELEPLRIVVRTPEMDARRARGIRVVAGIVGCLAALLAFGVVRANAAGDAAVTTPDVGVRQRAESAGEPVSIGNAAARGMEAARARAPVAEPAPPTVLAPAPAKARAEAAAAQPDSRTPVAAAAVQPPVRTAARLRSSPRPASRTSPHGPATHRNPRDECPPHLSHPRSRRRGRPTEVLACFARCVSLPSR